MLERYSYQVPVSLVNLSLPVINNFITLSKPLLLFLLLILCHNHCLVPLYLCWFLLTTPKGMKERLRSDRLNSKDDHPSKIPSTNQVWLCLTKLYLPVYTHQARKYHPSFIDRKILAVIIERLCDLTLLTAEQLSLRTVSIPLASYTGSFWSAVSYINPTYLFFVWSTHGK